MPGLGVGGDVRVCWKRRLRDVIVRTTFGEALEQALSRRYALALAEVNLGALTGLDLLASVDALHVKLPMMLIDDAMTARSALAALRLGAVDYLVKPLNLDFILLRVQNELERQSRTPLASPVAPKPPDPLPRSREEWLNPATRPAAFILRRPQFVQIERELQSLKAQTGASFAGLVDAAHNIVSAAGDLVRSDLTRLKQVLSEDYSGPRRLARALHEKAFTSTYLEGERQSIFIVDFGALHPVSLVVICPAAAKSGMVWLWAKRIAWEIEHTLAEAGS
jgi:CheY-like chemotaxis protein